MRFLLLFVLACSSSLAQPVMPFSPSSGGGGGGVTEVDPLSCHTAGCTMDLAVSIETQGTFTNPAISGVGANSNSGVVIYGTDVVGLVSNGNERLQISPSLTTVKTPLVTLQGTAAAPAITIVGDTDTGIYQAVANVLGFSTAGVARVWISASGQLLPATTSDIEDIGSTTAPWKNLYLGTSVEGVSNSKALQVVDVDGVQLTANNAQLTLQAGGNIVAQQETVGANGAPVFRLPAFANVTATSVGANLGCSSAAPGAVVVVDDSSSTSTKICVCARVGGVYAYRAIDNLANTCTGM